MRKRTVILVALCALGALWYAVPASAQSATRCDQLFPEARWESGGSELIDVGFSGVPDARANRFIGEIEETASLVSVELGGVDAAVVCVVGPNSSFDSSRYLEATKRFHAVLDHSNDALILSAENPANIKKSAAFGLPHLALWNLGDGEGWPEPLASAIAQWYRARALDRMALYRVQSTGADFSVDSVTGEGNFGLDFSTEARIEWTASKQLEVRAWDPETNDAPIGYFIEYTVSQEGLDALTETDPDIWRVREETWRKSLLVDLTGRTEPTTDWIGGLILAVLLVVGATALAVGGVVTKRRRERARTNPTTP